MKKYIALVIIIIISLIVVFYFHEKKRQIFDVEGEYVEDLNSGVNMILNNLEEKNIKYDLEKSKNDTVYSILISYKDEYENNYYMAYNVDMNTKEVLTNYNLLKQFGYTEDDVIKKINTRLEDLYNAQIEQGYMDTNECDFNCFKGFSLDIEDIYSMYSLYVKDNKLYIYLTFKYNSLLNDKTFYDNLDYNPFIIEL